MKKGFIRIIKKVNQASLSFTLIELLAVILVLAIILMISLPNIFNMVEKNKLKKYNLLIDSIEDSARLYVNEKKDELESWFLAGGVYYVTIKELNFKGLLKESLVNPLTNKTITDTKKVFIYPDNDNVLVYCFEDRDCAFDVELLPIIILHGDNPMILNLGISYQELGAIAKDGYGKDLNVEISGTVNSNQMGTYYIDYFAIDEEGHQAFAQREVQVVEYIIPTVAFSPKGNNNYSKTYNSKVTVTKGSVAIQSLKYLWNELDSMSDENAFTTTFNSGGILNTPAGLTGSYYLWILVTDTLDNTYFVKSDVFNLDNTPPSCTSKGGSSPWTKNNVTITGECSDLESGCKGDVSKTFSTTTNGAYSPGTVEDKAGNKTICPNQTVKVDKTAPSCASSGGSSSWTKNNVTITGKCSDLESGCKGDVSKTFNTDTNGSYSPGIVEDNVGNKTTCPTQTLRIDKTAPTITQNASGLIPQQFNDSTHYSPTLTTPSCSSSSCSATMTICKANAVMNVIGANISAFDNYSLASFVRVQTMYDKNGNPTPDGACYQQARSDAPCNWQWVYTATDGAGNKKTFIYNFTIVYAPNSSSPQCKKK